MSPIRRVGIVTSEEYPDLFAEEKEFPKLLRRHGIEAQPTVWSDPAVRWNTFDRLVIRSTWDYFTRIDAFRSWLSQMEALQVPLENPLPLVRWNFDKLYLAELAARGVRIVPTRFLLPGQSRSSHLLSEIVQEEGWPCAVLKPTISGGALRTVRFRAEDAALQQPELEAIWQSSAAMVQPFLPEIQTGGEWSLVFFEGQHSHTVIKKPVPGDFRVQGAFGGKFEQVEPPPTLLETASRIVKLLPLPPLYVRVDGVVLEEGFHLMEVEAIEPYLYTLGAPGAAERFAQALAARVQSGR